MSQFVDDYSRVMRPLELAMLELDDRYTIVLQMEHQMHGKSIAADPNFVWGAWRFWGKDVVESMDWENRYRLYRIIQHCYNDRHNIREFRMWRDRDLQYGCQCNIWRIIRDEPYQFDMRDYAMRSREEKALMDKERRYYARINARQ